MKPRLLSRVADAVGGRLFGGEATVSSVVVDSRKAGPGDLFFALIGEHADGHVYVTDAFAHGAAAAVVSREEDMSGPLVVVSDVGKALSSLAADERRGSDATVIGITGSSGKTTTKDFATAVLRSRFDVQASPGSYNNEIGLPLTILGETATTGAIVCELGSRGIGHITGLCAIATPDIGIITNVGVAHMESFGSLRSVADAKAELVESLTREGTAILSADDHVVRGFANRTSASVITYGLSGDATVRGEDIELSNLGEASFDLVFEGRRQRVELAIPGEHMVANALAATAAGLVMGVTLAESAQALREAPVSSWRMETFVGANGVIVVNDAYNANPMSTAAALKSARWMARDGRMVAVLGTMAELGHVSAEEHERIGELVARLRVERVIAVGEAARPIAVAAVREGVEPENVAAYEDPPDALADVRSWTRRGDVVLFKGSRVVGLEKLAEAMR